MLDITINDFKTYFSKEFSYLEIWNETKDYKKNNIVYHREYFYSSLINHNIGNIPNMTLGKWEEIEEDVDNYITDEDIEKAFGQARADFNTKLFRDKEALKICFLLLTAHYLVCDNNMSKGNGASTFLISSKSVDGVSASYSIPQSLINNQNFSYLAKTEFGLKYLHLLAPRLNGYFRAINGTTSIR